MGESIIIQLVRSESETVAIRIRIVDERGAGGLSGGSIRVRSAGDSRGDCSWDGFRLEHHPRVFKQGSSF